MKQEVITNNSNLKVWVAPELITTDFELTEIPKSPTSTEALIGTLS